ncbi:plancitoxin-1-like protein [Leptotrombidium deliense]|uniref:Plancitoxin-1-like protein n=1 Tax=Leptotrombidium deliense TaxID=299467 RepID=A0A443SEM0_9ACAR|nr:plancitoxin-1-like protein [Leptotrombidium deliense]
MCIKIVMYFSTNQIKKTTADLYCKDENGKEVDWFIIYTLPKINQRGESSFADGLKYAYISGPTIRGKSGKKEWKFSKKQVGDQDYILANTLLPVYNNIEKYSSIMYYDGVPRVGGKNILLRSYYPGNINNAYAKDVPVIDDESGFFLTHSIPRFPLSPSHLHYEYPSGASNNGQIGLCVPLKLNKSEQNFNSLISSATEWNCWNEAKKRVLKTAIETKIISYKGTTFTAFSKGKKYEADLYSDHFEQTCTRGAGNKLSSNCKSNGKVENAKALGMKFKKCREQETLQWLSTQDHAKWAFSDSEKSPFVCISDIYRM